MSIKCKIGFHSWKGCKCDDCGKFRNEHHNWSEDCEKCSECGKTSQRKHDWSKNCEKCFNCKKTRENRHEWNRFTCEICGEELILEGFNSLESSKILPWLEKVKKYFRQVGMNYNGPFGGYCDSCSSPIKKEHFYLMGSHARCERCMKKVLYNCKWSYYLYHAQQWFGSLPKELEKEVSTIRNEIDLIRSNHLK